MRSPSILRPLAACLGLLALFGCAGVYEVRVNGYTDPAQPAAITPGATFSVIENKEAKNPLLEKEITAKINKLLLERGYRLVPAQQADYFLLYSYGIGAGGAASVTMPSFGVGVGYGFWASRSYGMFWPGFYNYPAYADPLYDRWLLINVIEGRPYRDQGQSKTVWVGESRSTGTSADIREVINSLLLASFKQFGTNTGKAVEVDIRQDDPNLKALEKVR